MPESFHGHDLLELIGSRNAPWPMVEFRARALVAFGQAPTFHNCHGDGFTLDEMLRFFSDKGKVSLGLNTITLGPVGACGH